MGAGGLSPGCSSRLICSRVGATLGAAAAPWGAAPGSGQVKILPGGSPAWWEKPLGSFMVKPA